nr:hypothetical protein [Cytophagales bacterium]
MFTKSMWQYFTQVFILVWSLYSFIPHAHAQDVPATVDPSRFQRPFEFEEETLKAPEVQTQQDDPMVFAEPPEGAELYKFMLNSLELSGNTVFSSEELEKVYTGFLDKEISVDDVYKIADHITQYYRKRGFILARASVPPQEIDAGVVKISVAEGYIQNIHIEGKTDKIGHVARGIIEKIDTRKPFNSIQLEKKLLFLNKISGLKAVGVLQPVKNPENAHEGAVDLSIVFQEVKPSYVISADNNGSNYVGPWQGGISARVPNLLAVNGNTDLAFFMTPQTEELTYASVEKTIPLLSNGLSMEAGARFSRSEPGGSLNQIDLKSRYISVFTGLSYPLFLTRKGNLDVFSMFEYNNSESDILGTRFFDDNLRIIRAGLRGSHAHSKSGQIKGEITLSQGVDILGTRESGSIDLSRAQGRTDFTKIDAQVTHDFFATEFLAVKTEIAGQFSFSPLLSSEEFGFGGSNIGRGYNNSEITGDNGINLSLEASYYRWANYKEAFVPAVVPFAFYDFGKVWNRDDDTNPESGASIGGGLHLGWRDHGNFSFAVAQPLTRRIENPLYGNGKNPRFMMSYSRDF